MSEYRYHDVVLTVGGKPVPLLDLRVLSAFERPDADQLPPTGVAVSFPLEPWSAEGHEVIDQAESGYWKRRRAWRMARWNRFFRRTYGNSLWKKARRLLMPILVLERAGRL